MKVRCKIPLAIAFIFTGCIAFAQQVAKVSPQGTKYLLYTPPAYPSDGLYPLLIVLHGQGGMGNDLNTLLRSDKDDIPPKLIAHNSWPSRYPFIVVSPQLKRDPSVPDPADQVWPPEMVDEVVEIVRKDYAVDPNRIYVTGLSQGGHGSYSYAAAYPQKIAALLMISGVPDTTIACQVKDIPIWTFHGTDDGLVPPVFAHGTIRALRDCSPPGRFRPQLNMLYARRHEGWNEVYNNSNGYHIYDWLLKFKKNDPANTAPYVNAGNDLTLAARGEPIHLYGEFFDSDGTIASVRWSQVSGPAATLDGVGSKFLKLTNFTSGTYEFELRVTDDDGRQSADRVQLTVVPSASSMAVTGLTLLHGDSQKEIAALYDGFVVNPEDLRTKRINIRATASGSPGSVRFKINSNQNARTSDNAPYVAGTPRWTVDEPEYVVCATPFSGAKGTGTSGTSLCYRIVVSTEATPPPPPPPVEEEPPPPPPPVEEEPPPPPPPVEEEPPPPPPPVEEEPPPPPPPVEEEPPPPPPVEEEPPPPPPVEEEPPPPPPPVEAAKHFYAKAGADISVLGSWSSKPDGSGSAPASFTADGQTFEVGTKAALNNALAIGGTGTVFRILTGGELTIANSLTGAIQMDTGAVLHVNSGNALTFGSLNPGSTVHLNANAVLIPQATFGHLSLQGTGTTKTLSEGITRVAGTLTLAEGVALKGSAGQQSILKVAGHVNLDVTGVFEPSPSFTLEFEKGGPQNLNLLATRFAIHQIRVSASTVLSVNTPSGNGSVTLGSESGGGLMVDNGSAFLLKGDILSITGKGSINPGNQTGQVGVGRSGLQIVSASATHSNLHAYPGMDTVDLMSVNLTGTGSLVLQRPLYVSNVVRPENGIVNSNGYLTLVSTRERTARVESSNGTGQVAGEVIFQRFIPKEKQTRYISLPLKGVTVGDLQASIPVTGKFTGASTGGDSPSLFSFDETQGGWVPFPKSSNTETLAHGRGYSLLTTEEKKDAKLIVSGTLHQGEYTYTLTPNASNDPEKGWNLLGNPYASPIEWKTDGWTRDGAGTTAYVLDDRYAGGRFLVWDGTVGDPEFGGIISQGQGFFVRTTDATPVLKISNAATTDTTLNLMRGKTTQNHMVITLTKNELIDRAFVQFSGSAQNEFDASDAPKRKNGYFSLSTLSSDSISLAINYLGESFCDRSVAMLVETSEPGAYILKFEGSRFGDVTSEMMLVDLFTGTTKKISDGAQYAFQVTTDPASTGMRFRINMPVGSLQDPVISVEENILRSNVTSGNQWLMNGEEIDGATGATFEPEVSGEYSLRVTLDECSKLSDPVQVTVTVTGIHESTNKGVYFYPNPASQFIRIQLLARPVATVYYAVTNALGMEVASGELNPDQLLAGSEIDVRNFASGIYLLHLQTTGWKFQSKFIVDP